MTRFKLVFQHVTWQIYQHYCQAIENCSKTPIAKTVGAKSLLPPRTYFRLKIDRKTWEREKEGKPSLPSGKTGNRIYLNKRTFLHSQVFKMQWCLLLFSFFFGYESVGGTYDIINITYWYYIYSNNYYLNDNDRLQVILTILIDFNDLLINDLSKWPL